MEGGVIVEGVRGDFLRPLEVAIVSDFDDAAMVGTRTTSAV